MEWVGIYWQVIVDVIVIAFFFGFYFSDYKNLKMEVKQLGVDQKKFPFEVREVEEGFEKSIKAFETKLDSSLRQFEATLKQVELGFAKLQGSLEMRDKLENK